MTAPAAGGGDTRDGRRPPIPPPNPLLMATLDDNPAVPLNDTPARPAAAPADDTGELREVLAWWLAVEEIGDGGEWWETTERDDRRNEFRAKAARFLALPAVRDLTDGRRTDRARIAAVEALAAKAANFGTLHVWSGFEIAEHLRHALGGER